MRKAVYAGSFDCMTRGHQYIIDHVFPLVDELVLAIGVNPFKKTFFSLQERLSMLHDFRQAHYQYHI
jgi:pantetheine-phosphate adenylyltransferase